jgi:hypothetical protein
MLSGLKGGNAMRTVPLRFPWPTAMIWMIAGGSPLGTGPWRVGPTSSRPTTAPGSTMGWFPSSAGFEHRVRHVPAREKPRKTGPWSLSWRTTQDSSFALLAPITQNLLEESIDPAEMKTEMGIEGRRDMLYLEYSGESVSKDQGPTRKAAWQAFLHRVHRWPEEPPAPSLTARPPFGRQTATTPDTP